MQPYQGRSDVPVVEMRNVGMDYHTLTEATIALKHINFTVSQGEYVALVGPSGCGKSTVLSLVAGLLHPTEGEVIVLGRTVDKPRPEIGYMLQRDHLFEWRTIRQNVLLGLEVRGQVTPQASAYADELLKLYGLEDFSHYRPSQLSGGMRQRAALIRTLVMQPDVLLLDEPFSALDYQTRLAVSDEIGGIIRSSNKTCLMVTHDISEAISLADRVLVFSRRPAHIKSEFAIDLPGSALQRRQDPGFRDYFNNIWKELDVHVG